MQQPDILFVSLDTVRADVAYSGRLPGVESLRRAGVTFRQAMSRYAGWYPNDHAGEPRCRYEEGHGCLLFDTTQHVPLIIAGPGISAGREVHQQVRLADIMLTVLDLLGLEPSESDGASLTESFTDDKAPSRPAYSETYFPEELVAPEYHGLTPLASVRTHDGESRRKVIWETRGGRVETYDLNADPDEKNGLPLIGPAS